jgi:hypothetical protein
MIFSYALLISQIISNHGYYNQDTNFDAQTHQKSNQTARIMHLSHNNGNQMHGYFMNVNAKTSPSKSKNTEDAKDGDSSNAVLDDSTKAEDEPVLISKENKVNMEDEVGAGIDLTSANSKGKGAKKAKEGGSSNTVHKNSEGVKAEDEPVLISKENKANMEDEVGAGIDLTSANSKGKEAKKAKESGSSNAVLGDSKKSKNEEKLNKEVAKKNSGSKNKKDNKKDTKNDPTQSLKDEDKDSSVRAAKSEAKMEDDELSNYVIDTKSTTSAMEKSYSNERFVQLAHAIADNLGIQMAHVSVIR